MSFLSDIFDKIGSLIPSQTINVGDTGTKSSMISPFVSSGNAGPSSPSPKVSMAPFQSPAPSNQFRFQMGKSDYSSVRPQVENALRGTPLEPYINNFMQSANQHGVDPRVLVTVANNESRMGRNYPQNTFNPFGYNASGAGFITGPDGKQYVNTDQGLKNAGFTSLPMAIDRITQRFSDHPFNPTGPAYKTFRDNPTVENFAAAYNATPKENAGYVKNSYDLAGKYFQ